jgi:hypothetical protein
MIHIRRQVIVLLFHLGSVEERIQSAILSSATRFLLRSTSNLPRASRGAASRTVMRRGGAPRESMFERSEFRFAAPTQSSAVSRSACSPAAFSFPLFGRSKRGHVDEE